MFRFETLYYAKNNKMHLSVHLRKDKPFFYLLRIRFCRRGSNIIFWPTVLLLLLAFFRKAMLCSQSRS